MLEKYHQQSVREEWEFNDLHNIRPFKGQIVTLKEFVSRFDIIQKLWLKNDAKLIMKFYEMNILENLNMNIC